MRTRVGGALSRPAKCASTACGASNGAASAASSAIADERQRRRRASCAPPPASRCARGSTSAEREVRHQRAAGEEQRAGAGAAGDQIDVARAQRVEHQAAEARPRGDHFDRERSAEQRADDQAVDRRDRPERRLERVAPDDRAIAARRARAPRARTARRSPRSSPAPAAARTSRRAAARAPAPARRGGAADRAARRRPAPSPIASRRSATSRCAPRRRPGTATSAAAASTAGPATPRGSRRTARRRGGCRVTTPSGRPTSVATTSAVSARMAVFAARSGNQVARPAGRTAASGRSRAGRAAPSQSTVLRADRTCRGRSRARACSIVSRLRLRCRASRST